MQVRITRDRAPAIGDVRRMGQGDVIVLSGGFKDRPDWSRYAMALILAVSQGAEVRQG